MNDTCDMALVELHRTEEKSEEVVRIRVCPMMGEEKKMNKFIVSWREGDGSYLYAGVPTLTTCHKRDMAGSPAPTLATAIAAAPTGPLADPAVCGWGRAG